MIVNKIIQMIYGQARSLLLFFIVFFLRGVGNLVIFRAVGGVVGNAVSGALEATKTTSAVQTAAPADDMAAFKVKIDKLNMMKEAGLLSDEEFGQMKAKLLAEIM